MPERKRSRSLISRGLDAMPTTEQDAFLMRPLDATTAHTITDPENDHCPDHPARAI
jgi:hypothetical protein